MRRPADALPLEMLRRMRAAVAAMIPDTGGVVAVSLTAYRAPLSISADQAMTLSMLDAAISRRTPMSPETPR